MKKEIILAGAAALIAVTGVCAQAQTIESNVKTKGLFLTMVREYADCGAGTQFPASNSVSSSGVLSCAPIELRDNGNGASPYFMDIAKGALSVKISGKAEKDCQAKFDNPVLPAAPCFSAAIQVGGKGLLDTDGATPLTGTNFTLSLIATATFDDDDSGPMTSVEFPLNIDLPITQGKIKVKTTSVEELTVLGAGAALPVDIVIAMESLRIIDDGGRVFAHPGVASAPK